MGVPRVAPIASKPCPLVCETCIRWDSRRTLSDNRRVMPELMQAVKNLSQSIGIAGLYQLTVSPAWRHAQQWPDTGRDRRNGTLLALSRQVAVICHKVTTLRRLVGYGPSRLGQEAGMAIRVLDTPRVQFASNSEKTFTPPPHDPLHSHLSCIGARGVPNIDGATHASAG
jgi:hypothetical protein